MTKDIPRREERKKRTDLTWLGMAWLGLVWLD